MKFFHKTSNQTESNLYSQFFIEKILNSMTNIAGDESTTTLTTNTINTIIQAIKERKINKILIQNDKKSCLVGFKKVKYLSNASNINSTNSIDYSINNVYQILDKNIGILTLDFNSSGSINFDDIINSIDNKVLSEYSKSTSDLITLDNINFDDIINSIDAA
jgi:hypothetical protein